MDHDQKMTFWVWATEICFSANFLFFILNDGVQENHVMIYFYPSIFNIDINIFINFGWYSIEINQSENLHCAITHQVDYYDSCTFGLQWRLMVLKAGKFFTIEKIRRLSNDFSDRFSGWKSSTVHFLFCISSWAAAICHRQSVYSAVTDAFDDSLTPDLCADSLQIIRYVGDGVQVWNDAQICLIASEIGTLRIKSKMSVHLPQVVRNLRNTQSKLAMAFRFFPSAFKKRRWNTENIYFNMAPDWHAAGLREISGFPPKLYVLKWYLVHPSRPRQYKYACINKDLLL